MFNKQRNSIAYDVQHATHVSNDRLFLCLLFIIENGTLNNDKFKKYQITQKKILISQFKIKTIKYHHNPNHHYHHHLHLLFRHSLDQSPDDVLFLNFH